MNPTITRNGLWASLLLIGLFTVPILFLGIPEPDDFMSSEVVGHLFILISLIFVFIGMKQFREKNGGILSYWKAVKTGILIAIFPAIAFGLYNILYVEVIDPEFMVKYADHIAAQQSVGKSAEEAVEIREAVLEQQNMFGNPVLMFLVMFLSVLIMGAIVSLVSAFFVKKEQAD